MGWLADWLAGLARGGGRNFGQRQVSTSGRHSIQHARPRPGVAGKGIPLVVPQSAWGIALPHRKDEADERGDGQ